MYAISNFTQQMQVIRNSSHYSWRSVEQAPPPPAAWGGGVRRCRCRSAAVLRLPRLLCPPQALARTNAGEVNRCIERASAL